MAKQLLIAISFAILTMGFSTSAQSPAFTYQGRLTESGLPSNGTYEMRFSIHDAVSGGAQIGSTITNSSVNVSNGVFTVILDFSPAAPFGTGATRWIEIAVKKPTEPTFSTLSPRQQITSSPYAIRTLSATTADGLSNLCESCVTDQMINTVSGTKVIGPVANAVDADNVVGVVPIANGGTQATTAAAARTNLGLGSLATVTPTGTAAANTYLSGTNTWSTPVSEEIIGNVMTQFSVDDRSGWTHVETLGDDTCTANIPLGFTFTGWGRSNTTVSVSSNGNLFFGSLCSSSFSNTSLPSAISTDPFVSIFWDDMLDTGSGEYFEYITTGTAPARVFHLYFRNRLFSSACGTDPVVIMMSIHEGSNHVVVSYLGMSGCSLIRGGSATFGMQGPGGASAKFFSPGFNAQILDDNQTRNLITYQPPKQ